MKKKTPEEAKTKLEAELVLQVRVIEESLAKMATETESMLPNDVVDTVVQNFEELAKCEITSRNC